MEAQHAVVCYVGGELGAWAEGLRRELAPGQAHLRAHITLLQPRRLNAETGAETEAETGAHNGTAAAGPGSGAAASAAGGAVGEKPSGTAGYQNPSSSQDDAGPAEAQARDLLHGVCRELAPIRVSLGAVKTFLPLHPTVYVEVEHGARHLRYINDRLNRGPLRATSPWDYVPHLTLVSFDSAAPVAAAHQKARAAWQAYSGGRELMMEEFTLVREEAGGLWRDVESFPLGQ